MIRYSSCVFPGILWRLQNRPYSAWLPSRYGCDVVWKLEVTEVSYTVTQRCTESRKLVSQYSQEGLSIFFSPHCHWIPYCFSLAVLLHNMTPLALVFVSSCVSWGHIHWNSTTTPSYAWSVKGSFDHYWYIVTMINWYSCIDTKIWPNNDLNCILALRVECTTSALVAMFTYCP